MPVTFADGVIPISDGVTSTAPNVEQKYYAKENETMPDVETVVANIRKDIDLLTHGRQPTADELRIINDLSAAVVLLKEQEAEVELCERCGRVRLKSKWEGR
jgi:hypothetical protein